MEYAVGALLAFFFVFWLIKKASSGSGPRLGSGTPARGLVLAASQTASGGVTLNGVRYERRQMTIDVEVFGQAPYATTGFFLIPRGQIEAVPGSSLELSVDGRNQITVLGPGGFTGPWLQYGPPSSY